MKIAWITIGILACLGVGYWAGRASRPAEEAGGQVVSRSGESPGPSEIDETEGVRLGTEAMQLANARTLLEEERTAHRETIAALAAERAAHADAPGEAAARGEEAGAEGPAGSRYVFREVQEILAQVDWEATGESVAHMGPLLAELAASLVRGDEIPAGIAEIQRWNSALLGMALAVKEQGIPGTGIPGAYSHPSIVVNMVHAALVQGGLPLDEERAQRLGMIGDRYVTEDARRLASYDDRTLRMQQVIEETQLKDLLYADIDALLTDEQRELLHPAVIRGRCGLDILSSAVVWNGLCYPLRFENRADLAAKLVALAQSRMEFPEGFLPTLETIAERWAAGFTDQYLNEEPDEMYRRGSAMGGNTGMPVARARVAAAQALLLYRSLLEHLPPDGELAAQVRDVPLVPVPMQP